MHSSGLMAAWAAASLMWSVSRKSAVHTFGYLTSFPVYLLVACPKLYEQKLEFVYDLVVFCKRSFVEDLVPSYGGVFVPVSSWEVLLSLGQLPMDGMIQLL